MKTKNLKEMIISVIAVVVKLFPSLALKFTKKTNPYAEYFMLSHKNEMKLLSMLKGTMEEHLAFVSARLWQPQTKEMILKKGEWTYFFLDEIKNKEEFDWMYNNPHTEYRANKLEQFFKSNKFYTLNLEQAIQVANDPMLVAFVAENQKDLFAKKIAPQINSYSFSVYITKMVKNGKMKKLEELDVLMFRNRNSSSESLRETIKRAFAFLFSSFDYEPNLSGASVLSLNDLSEPWVYGANPFIVAKICLSHFAKHHCTQEIEGLVRRMIEYKASQPNAEVEIADALPYCAFDREFYQKMAALIIKKNNIACPREFPRLVIMAPDFEYTNIQNCIKSNVLRNLPVKDFDYIRAAYKEDVLIALAKSGALDGSLLHGITTELHQKLIEILDENAQTEWLNTRLHHSPNGDDIDILKGGKIYTKTQDLTFQDSGWVDCFVDNHFYDEDHICMLLNSNLINIIKQFILKDGLTQKQYEFLLFSNNKNLAPWAKLYVKKDI